MVEVPVQDFELSVEVFFNELFQLTLHEHVVVTMIDSGLLLIISHTCLNEGGFLLSFVFTDLFIPIFKLFILIIFLTLVLLVSVLEIPFHEYILLLEFLVFLLVSPNVNEASTTCPHHSVELRNSLYPQRVRRKMMDHSYRYNPVNGS